MYFSVYFVGLYRKCMGTLDGSGGNRPGQLGDTGIIVLQHCGPLLKKGQIAGSELTVG